MYQLIFAAKNACLLLSQVGILFLHPQTQGCEVLLFKLFLVKLGDKQRRTLKRLVNSLFIF
jgi:hypothetical protein